MRMPSSNEVKCSNYGAISVIMPVHNESPDVLDQSIQSVLSQTVQVSELIICDDGSADTTWEALKKWRHDKRIIILRNKEPRGAANARNRAIRIATGDYIALMDADDISSTKRIEKELAFLMENPEFEFVGCRGELFEEIIGDLNETYRFISYPLADDFLMTLPFVHASLLFRKHVLYDVGGYRDIKRVWRSEDYDMLLRLYQCGYKGANLSDTLYYIRTDRNTIKRRKYRYRFIEASVKFEGFARLGLLPKGLPYVIKPLVVGLIPERLLQRIKSHYYRKEERRKHDH